MARCAAIKPNGERCKAEAIAGAGWCYSHHPDHAEERRRRASKAGKAGGRGRPAMELKDVKALCEDLTNRVLAGDLLPGSSTASRRSTAAPRLPARRRRRRAGGGRGRRPRRAAGEPLHGLAGVPIAVKDLLCTVGQPTTCGSRILEGWVPPYDATVVTRLRAAGMPILGKTNLDEFAMGSSTEHSAYGPTRNPWDTDRTPGRLRRRLGRGGRRPARAARDRHRHRRLDPPARCAHRHRRREADVRRGLALRHRGDGEQPRPGRAR